MPDPPIRYTRTEDGLDIAFWEMGDGPAMVMTSPVNYSHVEMELRIAPLRQWYERLAERWRVIRFDARGWGLSERQVHGFDLNLTAKDIDAVARAVDAERFALFGMFGWGPVTITYAATRPERVTHLLTWQTSVNVRVGWPPDEHIRVISTLSEKDWNLYTENLAHVMLGWGRGQAAHEFADIIRASVSQDFIRSWLEADTSDDASLYAKQVKCPTLVLASRENQVVPFGQATLLASMIPGAQLKTVEGRSLVPYGRAGQVIIDAISDFTGVRERATREAAAPSSFRTILFTDLVGHSEMMSRLGDERGRGVLREHERITREVLKAHAGTEVKTMGDGFMASFGSVTKAVECAIALQRAFGERDAQAHHDAPLQIRVGLNAGEPIEEEGDLFGATVIQASRVAAKAEGGEILVADTVRGLCSGKGFLFADRGEFVAKGFEDPVRLYEVRWRD
jgi:class 3 adenylate cyclase/pimeloyl-ACP methyl ester carboxylesterase